MRFRTMILGIGAMCLFLAPSVWAQEFGIIMDFTAAPSLERAGESSAVEVGTELLIGDVLNITSGGQLVFVAYKTCEEVTLFEAGEVTIADAENISTEKGQKWQIRQLPVCYKPESFPYNGPNITGGILLRGMNSSASTDDEIARMRAAAERAEISNSELVSLIVYDLQNDNKEMAKSYHELLMDKNPDAILPAHLLQQLAAD